MWHSVEIVSKHPVEASGGCHCAFDSSLNRKGSSTILGNGWLEMMVLERQEAYKPQTQHRSNLGTMKL